MIVVTGANGKLGQHVIRGLLDRVPAREIVAAVRNPEKAGDLRALGIQLRHADYDRPETLATAFHGAEKLLLISSNELGRRVPQQQAVVQAAKLAEVGLLAYTSILRADTSTLALASDHKETEESIRRSGLPFVFLRNGWYLENHTDQIGPAIEHGALLGAAGNGNFASAARSDYAAAAVAVLTEPGHENKTYELAGDTAYTLTELAAEISRGAGKPVLYRNLPQAEYAGALAGFGLPTHFANILADADACAANGQLDSSSADLHTLIRRPTLPMAQAVSTALAATR